MSTISVPNVCIAVIKKTDSSLTYLYVNDLLAELYGIPANDFIGQPLNFTGSLSLPTIQFINNFSNSDYTFDFKHVETTKLPLCLLAYKLHNNDVLLIGFDCLYKLDILHNVFDLLNDPVVIYYNKEIFYSNKSFQELYDKYRTDINFTPNKYFRLGESIYQLNTIRTKLNEALYVINVYRDVTLEMNLTSELETQVNQRTQELNKEIEQRKESETKLKALLSLLPKAIDINPISDTTINKVTTQPLNNVETEVLVRKLEGDVERITKTLYYNGSALTGRVLNLEGNITEDRNKINEIEKKLESINNLILIVTSILKFFNSRNGLIMILVITGLLFGFGGHVKVYQMYKTTVEFLNSKD